MSALILNSVADFLLSIEMLHTISTLSLKKATKLKHVKLLFCLDFEHGINIILYANMTHFLTRCFTS